MSSFRLLRTEVAQAFEASAGWAPLREPSVVHTSHGRLRVHLPHWPGTHGEQIVAGVRRLPGVTSAEANPLTGNVLIWFEPRQTSAPALLDALPTLRLEQPVGPPLFCGECERPSVLLAASQSGSVVYMSGTGRVIYTALGWTSVGMAVVGAITPGIPTAPFVILGGYFFIRASPEAHEWLRQSHWFGPLLRDWEAHRGVRRSVRNAALVLIGGSMAATAFMPLSVALKVTILGLQAIGVAVVLNLRLVEPVPFAPTGSVVQQGNMA
jgi:uncharacterized membrane protein YbaN (DUF454 family)